ncbi:MAG: hypothetical protein JW701_00695 [Kosmotogaceae bacterium]|nr:hypothetical protein [Kosmotogaceae bacterium]
MEFDKVSKPKGKTMVISDYREKEIIDDLKSFGAHVNKTSLPVGDFVCSDRVVVERKDHSDFIASIIDGRIFEQAERMKESYEKPIFIIEGNSNRDISINSLKGAIAVLAIDHGSSVISTKNPKDTALTIFWLAKKEQHSANRKVVVRGNKKSKDENLLKEQIVCSLPGVSTVLCKRLLEHFTSVESIFGASEDELMEVDGIGKKMARSIRQVVEEEWNIKP